MAQKAAKKAAHLSKGKRRTNDKYFQKGRVNDSTNQKVITFPEARLLFQYPPILYFEAVSL